MSYDAVERQYFLCRAQRRRRAGHAEHHGGLLVLGNGLPPGVLDMQKARGAIGAETGKHHSDRLRPVRSGDRAEEYVTRRPLSLNQILVAQDDHPGTVAVAAVSVA